MKGKSQFTQQDIIDMKRLKILLVEDDKSLCLTLAQALRLGSEGRFEVETVDSAERALPLLKQKKYDGVICDYCLPGEDGLSVIAKLKQISPSTQTILMTGFGSDEVEQQADEISGGYLTKPFNMQDLLVMVQQVMDDPSGLAGHSYEYNHLDRRESSRILVIEDDSGLRQIYTKALRKSRYLVDEAASIEAARKLLSQRSYGILICNIRMGRERGTDLLKELREKLDHNGTQIILCASYGQYPTQTEEMGVNYYLDSPISLGTLLPLVSRLMDAGTNTVSV